MKKTWQLRVSALYLALGVPLAASCAREANTLEDAEPTGAAGSSASTAGNAGKGGSGSGKAGATGAFGGTSSKAGAGSGGKATGNGGDTMADGGDAPSSGSGGTAGSGTAGSAGMAGSGGTGVSPDVLARASAIVYYQTSHPSPSDGTIQMKLYIKNQSADALPMASVKIRYWFTAEVTAALHQYYTGPEAKQPQAMFVDDGENSHTLLTFGGGSIMMGGDLNASEVQLEMTNNGGKFDQSDDHSWLPSASASTPNDKITLYLADKLIWGCEPSGACFDDGAGGATGAGGAP